MKVKGAVVFVTGASRGLGLAFVHEALARGAAKVYAGVRHVEGFDVPGAIPVKMDVTNPASIADAVKFASDTTLLVNNAGIAELTPDMFALSVEDQSRRFLETNYFGVVRTTTAFQSILPQDGTGGIINVLSDATWKAAPIIAPYAASKAAAWSYTNSARLQLEAKKIQVLGLHVGFIDTDLTKGIDVPKSTPQDVVRETYDALEAGELEVMADAGTRALKQTLAAKVPGYMTA